MSFKIEGCSEGHTHLTKIDGYLFGYVQLINPNPLLETARDGYASSFKRLYKRYRTRAAKDGLEFKLNEVDLYYLTSQLCFYSAAPPPQRVSKKSKRPYVYTHL